MSSIDVKKVKEIKKTNDTNCIMGIEGIENIEILANLKNLDYLKGIDTDNIKIPETLEISNEEVIELVQAGKTIIESTDKIVETFAEVHKEKEKETEATNVTEAIEINYSEDSQNNKNVFMDSIKKLGVRELFVNLKNKSNNQKEIDKNSDDEIDVEIDEEFINHLKPRIFRSRLNEINNREAPSTIQKLFKYTKKSHKFNNFQNLCRTLKMSYLKFKHKDIEFFEWHNTEESEKLLLQWVKNINTNWSLKYKEHEKTVYNNIPLIHKKRLLYIDPFGYIESGTTLYKIKLYKVDDEYKYLVKLMD